MASKLVNIAQAFTLTIIREGQMIEGRFEAGLQRLEQDVADHWYTQAHTAEVTTETAPVVDTDAVPVKSDTNKASKK